MSRLLLFLPLFLGVGPVLAHAQEPTLEFVQMTSEGNALLRIDGTAYTALPDTVVRRMSAHIAKLQQTIQGQKQKLALKDTMITELDSTISAYERTFRIQEGLLERTMSLYEGYRELSDLYGQQYTEPIFRISAGLGVLRDEDNDITPGVLGGVSIRRISLWGFVNQEQTGFILGLNQPIQFGIFR